MGGVSGDSQWEGFLGKTNRRVSGEDYLPYLHTHTSRWQQRSYSRFCHCLYADITKFQDKILKNKKVATKKTAET